MRDIIDMTRTGNEAPEIRVLEGPYDIQVVWEMSGWRIYRTVEECGEEIEFTIARIEQVKE